MSTYIHYSTILFSKGMNLSPRGLCGALLCFINSLLIVIFFYRELLELITKPRAIFISRYIIYLLSSLFARLRLLLLPHSWAKGSFHTQGRALIMVCSRPVIHFTLILISNIQVSSRHFPSPMTVQ